jgi:hypothetical protein
MNNNIQINFLCKASQIKIYLIPRKVKINFIQKIKNKIKHDSLKNQKKNSY